MKKLITIILVIIVFLLSFLQSKIENKRISISDLLLDNTLEGLQYLEAIEELRDVSKDIELYEEPFIIELIKQQNIDFAYLDEMVNLDIQNTIHDIDSLRNFEQFNSMISAELLERSRLLKQEVEKLDKYIKIINWLRILLVVALLILILFILIRKEIENQKQV